MGLRNIVIPTPLVESWLKQMGVIRGDSAVVRLQDSVERNSLMVTVSCEAYPDMEPGEKIPAQIFSGGNLPATSAPEPRVLIKPLKKKAEAAE